MGGYVMKKVLFLSQDAPAADRKCWSGIPFSLYQELKKYYDIDTEYVETKCSIIANVKCVVERYIFRRFISVKMTKAYSKKAKKIVERYLKNQYDYIFCTNNVGAIAEVETNIPIIYFSDCVAANMFEYYWFGASEKTKKEANNITQKALDNSAKIVLTSNWAKNEALSFYGIDSKKIVVANVGANIETADIFPINHDGINLLFVGVDWERKGAQIAIDCVEWLNKHDETNKYTLHLIGCEPPYEIQSKHVKVYGFLNRNIDDEKELLESIRRISDIFILPTKAECAGIVFCEASAYGIPSITYDTGGIGDYVINDYNGFRLPINSSGEEFGKLIKELITRGNLPELKCNARKMYEEKLNWAKTGEIIKETFNEIAGEKYNE